MANKRMFSQTITNSDRFLDMPQSTQLLYFHLGMQADDDGFLDNYNSIMRNVKCNADDLRLLIAKNFVIGFDSGVIVIRDWRVHNQLRKDRYHPTKYLQERQQLQVLDNGEYALVATGCQVGNQMATEYSIEENSIGKVSIEEKRESAPAPARKPTIDEVKAFCDEQGIAIDVDLFYNYYECRGWLLDGKPVRDWKALVKVWYSREVNKRSQQSEPKDTGESWLEKLGTIL